MPLDPTIREKLLQESKNPYKGLRRIIWLAFFASASVGLLIMGLRYTTGEFVHINDLAIQLSAFFLFGSLVIFDRDKKQNIS